MARLAVLQLLQPDAAMARWAGQLGTPVPSLRRLLDPTGADYDEARFRAWVAHYQAYALGRVTQAGEAGAELVLLPEGVLPLVPFMRRRLADRFREAGRWSADAFLAEVSGCARRYHMTVASCLYLAEGEGVVNAVVLTGPDGEVTGIYRKTHLPCYEDEEVEITEAGTLAAGHEYPVFDTAVGRVGCLICYDVIFPEVARILALQGADVLLHPSQGYNFPDEEEAVGEARLRVRAAENSVALMYANCGGPGGNSAIVDRRGTVRAAAGRAAEALAVADVDLAEPRIPGWLRPGYEHREHLWRKRRPNTYGLLCDPRPPVLQTLHEEKQAPLYHYREDAGLP